MPFSSKCLYGTSTPVVLGGKLIAHTFSYALSTSPTLGGTQTNMTCFAIRMSFINGEANIILKVERAITMNRNFMSLPNSARRTRLGLGGREERIAAFGAEEMLFVVRPLSKCWVVECDEAFVDDGCLARITLWCE